MPMYKVDALLKVSYEGEHDSIKDAVRAADSYWSGLYFCDFFPEDYADIKVEEIKE